MTELKIKVGDTVIIRGKVVSLQTDSVHIDTGPPYSTLYAYKHRISEVIPAPPEPPKVGEIWKNLNKHSSITFRKIIAVEEDNVFHLYRSDPGGIRWCIGTNVISVECFMKTHERLPESRD